MAEDFPAVQIQGGPGPRRLVNLPHNNAVSQFIRKNARGGGFAFVQKGTNVPAFSEHPKYCRLYVNDAAAVRAALELAASKYGIPLTVNGDPHLCKIILAAAAEMGIAISSNTVTTPTNTQVQAAPTQPKTQTGSGAIPNGTLVEFVPSDQRMPTHEGVIKDSSTADGISYRYRLELSDKRLVSVYSDEGKISPVAQNRNQDTPIENRSNATIATPTTPVITVPAWRLSKSEYLADLTRVRADVGMRTAGYKVDYEYTKPGIAGPFSGVLITPLPSKPEVGEIIAAPFGEATVTKASSSSFNMDDPGVARAGKLHHRRLVVDAIMEGKPVPAKVLAEYLEVQPIIDKWVQEQLASGQLLAATHYNGAPSKRGGIINVTYEEQSDSYSVIHVINGKSFDHVTGVDAEGAREATHKLFGHEATRTMPTLPTRPVQPVKESKPLVEIKPIPSIDLSKVIEEADASGQTDLLAVLQTAFDELTAEANDRISAAVNQQTDYIPMQDVSTEMALRDWTQTLDFLGSDPVAIANKWRNVITERDGLQDQVIELKEQLENFVDKITATEDEAVNE